MEAGNFNLACAAVGRTPGPRPKPSSASKKTSERDALKVDDGGERHSFQTGAAYQHAIDLGLSHQSARVVRLDAAAVEDAHGAPGIVSKRVADLLADDAMRVGRDFRR